MPPTVLFGSVLSSNRFRRCFFQFNLGSKMITPKEKEQLELESQHLPFDLNGFGIHHLLLMEGTPEIDESGRPETPPGSQG